MRSLTEHGFYRNIVVAKDNTILAGHGVVLASTKLGFAQVPVIRLDIEPDSTLAMKVLTGDNQISLLAEDNDQLLNEIDSQLLERGELLGTGIDEQQLRARLMLTRPPDSLTPKNEQQEWAQAGMPDYEPGAPSVQLIMQFRTEQDREQFVNTCDIAVTKRGAKGPWSTWWPPQGTDGHVVKWVGTAS